MDQAINPKGFQILDKIANTKENVKLSLRQKFQNIKLETIKDSLKENNIKVPDDVSSIKELKKVLKDQLDDISYSQVVKIIDDVSAAYNEMLVSLENGSMDALSKFLKKADKILKPMAKIAGKSLASRTALILAPTIASKLVVAGGIVAGNVYKLIKNKKEGKVVTQEVECDKILQELEITRDDGVITDTRFNDEIQEEIRKFLDSKKVEFTDTGYLSLREAIYSLSYDNKKELCNLINSRLGRGININERLEAKKGGFFANLKDKFKQIFKPAATGVGVATAINTIDPALLAGPLNGTVIGKFVSSIANSKFLGAIAGVVSGALTKVAEIIPGFGEIAEKIFSAENIVFASVVGTGVGVAGLVATNIIKIIKGFSEKFKYNKEWKKIQEFDATKYNDDNAKELEVMKEALNEHENTKIEQSLFDFIYEYLVDELNITFEEKPKNITQLSEAISKLDDSDKKKATKFLGKLDDYNSNDHGDFVNALIKGGKVVSTLAMAGLAGLSVYDIIKGGQFLPELGGKIFKDVDGNIYNLIPEKEKIVGIDYKDKIPNTDDKVSMISDNEMPETVDNYNKLSEMVKDGNKLEDYKEALIDGGRIMTEPLENPVGSIKDIHSLGDVWKYLGNYFKMKSEMNGKFFDFAKKEAEATYNYAVNLLDKGPGVETIADRGAIRNYISGLSDEQLLNLAYYYNKSTGIKEASPAHEVIGSILNEKKYLRRIVNAIEVYNKHMKQVREVNKMLIDGGTVLPIIVDVDEQIKKNIN